METQNNLIDANDRSVRQILDKVKYTIDVFQREYKWQSKHMGQLIDDLTSKFLVYYKPNQEREEVGKYGKYYLGSIVVCVKDGKRSIIDGQQRLSSVTLLLIYLNNLQKDREENKRVKFEELIFSEKYSKKSFNLQVEDREKCIESLYNTGNFEPSSSGESVINLVERYGDLSEKFPEELKGDALPYFIDWLIDNVIFVEIATYSDDDAYTIFESMNDRGLNLTSAEMLKGYLISNLASQEDKIKLNELWKNKILEFNEIEKDEDLRFFQSWLRGKYAESLRAGKKGSENEDFEKIGTRFHSWVRDNKDKIGLKNKADFYKFINDNFTFYQRLYMKIDEAANDFNKTLESIYYLEDLKFARTFYFPILMSPIKITDDETTINQKLALTSKFLEMFIVFRSVNKRTMGYSAIKYTMFKLATEIRDKDPQELCQMLKAKVEEFEENLEDGMDELSLQGNNKRFIHFLLARITRYIEEKNGVVSSFEEYMNAEDSKPFEIEHIWSNNFDEHQDEFDQRDDWEEYRNNVGALLLLPNGFNQSYGELPYDEKLPHYYGQNLLAKSLNKQCYEHNPTFLRFIQESTLPFKAYDKVENNGEAVFKRNNIIERNQLYLKICEKIYSIKSFDEIIRD